MFLYVRNMQYSGYKNTYAVAEPHRQIISCFPERNLIDKLDIGDFLFCSFYSQC